MSKARSRWPRIFRRGVDGKTLCPAPERDSLEARAALLIHADVFTAHQNRRSDEIITHQNRRTDETITCVLKKIGLDLKAGKPNTGFRVGPSSVFRSVPDVDTRIESEVLTVLIMQGYLASTVTVDLIDRWSDCGIYDLTHACTSRCDGVYAGKQAIVRVNAQVNAQETTKETNSDKTFREKMEWLNKH